MFSIIILKNLGVLAATADLVSLDCRFHQHLLRCLEACASTFINLKHALLHLRGLQSLPYKRHLYWCSNGRRCRGSYVQWQAILLLRWRRLRCGASVPGRLSADVRCGKCQSYWRVPHPRSHYLNERLLRLGRRERTLGTELTTSARQTVYLQASAHQRRCARIWDSEALNSRVRPRRPWTDGRTVIRPWRRRGSWIFLSCFACRLRVRHRNLSPTVFAPHDGALNFIPSWLILMETFSLLAILGWNKMRSRGQSPQAWGNLCCHGRTRRIDR